MLKRRPFAAVVVGRDPRSIAGGEVSRNSARPGVRETELEKLARPRECGIPAISGPARPEGIEITLLILKENFLFGRSRAWPRAGPNCQSAARIPAGDALFKLGRRLLHGPDIVHDVYATSNSGKIRCHCEPLFGAMTVKRATRDGTSRRYVMSRSLLDQTVADGGRVAAPHLQTLSDILTTMRNDGTGRAT